MKFQRYNDLDNYSFFTCYSEILSYDFHEFCAVF